MGIFKPAQPRVLRAACGCHVGKRRKNNEDNFYFNGSRMECDNAGTEGVLTLEPGLLDNVLQKDCFFAVFDGMGGGDYGEVASYTAAKAAENFFSGQSRVDVHDVTVSLEEYCMQANEEVVRAGSGLGAAHMGSTMVSLYFLDGRAWVCNLGDSPCFLLRDGQLRQLSVEHTDGQEMKANGITGRKPYLTQYLGIDPSEMRIEPYVKNCTLHTGDIFLLCSDGLTDMVELSDIRRTLLRCRSPKEAVETLVQAALEAGGKDNITIMVCQC